MRCFSLDLFLLSSAVVFFVFGMIENLHTERLVAFFLHIEKQGFCLVFVIVGQNG